MPAAPIFYSEYPLLDDHKVAVADPRPLLNSEVPTIAELDLLDRMLLFRNDAVTQYFHSHYLVSFDDAHVIFIESLRWLWLDHMFRVRSQPVPLAIEQDLPALSAMWHTFALFPRSYSGFCFRHFGRYVHHPRSGGCDQPQHHSSRAVVRARGTIQGFERRWALAANFVGDGVIAFWRSELATLQTRT